MKTWWKGSCPVITARCFPGNGKGSLVPPHRWWPGMETYLLLLLPTILTRWKVKKIASSWHGYILEDDINFDNTWHPALLVIPYWVIPPMVGLGPIGFGRRKGIWWRSISYLSTSFMSTASSYGIHFGGHWGYLSTATHKGFLMRQGQFFLPEKAPTSKDSLKKEGED